MEDDRVPSYEDTCSFTCNTGYELTGSDTRVMGAGVVLMLCVEEEKNFCMNLVAIIVFTRLNSMATIRLVWKIDAAII